MKQFVSVAIAAGILALAGASAASAQSARAVERSGRVFHIRACPTTEGAFTARCFAHIVTDIQGNILTRLVTRNATPAGYGPNDLTTAYNVHDTGSTGVTVAIVDAYGYPNAASDLAVYRSQYGLPACTTSNGCLRIVNQSGGSNLPRTNTGWDQEQALDLDMVSAMCPNCKILLVQASTASYVNLGTAVNTAVRLGAHVVSNSYGGSEGGTTNYEGYYNHPGVAITVSSGDSGYGVQFPASSPHVTAVGGTSLTSINPRAESAWSGAGSGCSSVYAKPVWQTDGLCGTRMEADVSAVADPNTGVAVYGPPGGTRSAWMVFGGTSVAAPLVGALYGRNGGSVNYGQNPYLNLSALNDVTTGSNGSCGGSYECTAVQGYDGPTGLGTPNTDTAF